MTWPSHRTGLGVTAFVLLTSTAVPTVLANPAASCSNRAEAERNFIRLFQDINRNIRVRQAQLERMIADSESSEQEIRDLTQDLIRWRARRDTAAIDYILKARRDDCPLPPEVALPRSNH